PPPLFEPDDPHVGPAHDVDAAERKGKARPIAGLEKRQRQQWIGNRPLTRAKVVAVAFTGDAPRLFDGIVRALLKQLREPRTPVADLPSIDREHVAEGQPIGLAVGAYEQKVRTQLAVTCRRLAEAADDANAVGLWRRM